MVEDAIIETRELTKEFSGFTAVSGVNLRIQRNSIHALIGPNGAGKTTCFNLITGFLRPSKGQVIYDGRDITGIAPAIVARLGMIRSFQISAVFGKLTVLDNVIVALQRKDALSFKFWRPTRVLDRFIAKAEQLIDDVGLTEYISIPAGELSYGRKRALEIATTLALDPPMMLLDEPMAGMGVEDTSKITDLIRRISPNRTILMVEHNLSVVADLSDTITVLEGGQILTEGTYEQVSTNPAVIDAYMGGAHG
jgi:branched-chain amino acid transport system ATP-binding protein